MDKKPLLSSSLAIIMFAEIPKIKELLGQYPYAAGRLKDDGTPVTSLDLALSATLESACHHHYPGHTVYSEENYDQWKFPLIAIDPLDGTKEYLRQRPEWAVSVGVFESENFTGEGWVYNPVTTDLFDGSTPALPMSASTYRGEVSHSEWDRGWYRNFRQAGFSLSPMGSIAYKLGRLSAGKCDFVVSLAPKNIWDIAGGSLLCQKQGINFYSQGKLVTKVEQLYQPPLIWCREELFSQLSAFFPSTDKYL